MQRQQKHQCSAPTKAATEALSNPPLAQNLASRLPWLRLAGGTTKTMDIVIKEWISAI